MANVNELRMQRAMVWEQAKKFLDSHRNEKNILSAEDNAAYEKMEKEIVDLGHEIERQERADALDREMNAPLSTPIMNRPEVMGKDEKKGRAADAYKKAFWNQMRSRNAGYEVRNTLTEGQDTEGGYLVPDEFEHTLVQALNEENVLRQYCHVFTTSSGTHQIPVVGAHGEASWVDETGSYEPEGVNQDETFGQKLIGAHKIGTLIKVSEELLNDSAFDLEAYFRSEFARRIGNTEENAFLNGNGTKKPTGILNATDGAEVGVAATGKTAITADEVIDLFYSLKAPYRKNAIWVLNDATVKAIRKLKDGNGQYLWQPGLSAGESDVILGHKVITSAHAPLIGAGNKAIAFGDFSFYWVGDREGISFKRLNERYADAGLVGFLASKRVDAKLTVPEAIKVLQLAS